MLDISSVVAKTSLDKALCTVIRSLKANAQIGCPSQPTCGRKCITHLGICF